MNWIQRGYEKPPRPAEELIAEYFPEYAKEQTDEDNGKPRSYAKEQTDEKTSD